MRALLLVLLLAGAAQAKPAKKAVPPKDKAPEVSASTGAALPAYEPSTAPITAALVLERVSEVDARLTSLQAEFTQSVRSEQSDTVQSIEGSVWYKKKDQLRLQHRVPETQLAVSDGRSLWVHRPSVNQVIVTKLSDWRKSEPMAQGLLNFGAYGDLLKRYEVSIDSVSAPDAAGYRQVRVGLTPREKGPEAFKLTLGLSTRDFFPAEFSLVVGEISSTVRFRDVRFNPELADTLFRFTPPPGADVFQKPGRP